jgi:hypothetical protein
VSELVIQGSCPECGAPYEAGVWDHTHVCDYCESLLALTRDESQDAYVVSDGDSTPGRLLQILIRHEAEAHRARLLGRYRQDPGLGFEPPNLDARVEAFEEKLAAKLRLAEQVDFFVPYRILERAVAQAVLGRRSLAKESYLQLFHSEELCRDYDTGAHHLRDRGLKIRGFRLARLTSAHLELAKGRFLAQGSAEPPVALDRTRKRVRGESQIISRHCGVWRQRELRVYKHLSYARVERGRRDEHYLFDRQFGTIAARLEADEAEGYRRLSARLEPSALPSRPQARVLASECPNCGWDLAAAERERISFCQTCHVAVAFGDKQLERIRYRAELAGDDGAEQRLYFPFWAFPFQLEAGGQRYTTIRSWLEAVAPQPKLAQLALGDPDPSLYFVPARALSGSPEADALFELLVRWAAWRQPELVPERPTPEDHARFLGVEIGADEAAELARYALVALHDNASTRRLNARSFKLLIAEARLELGSPELALLPLSLQQGEWRPSGLRGHAAVGLLSGESQPSCLTQTYGLRSRASS